MCKFMRTTRSCLINSRHNLIINFCSLLDQVARNFQLTYIFLQVLEQIEAGLVAKLPRFKLAELTSKFYTIIPHDFGRTTPPIIDNHETLQKKFDMLLVSIFWKCLLFDFRILCHLINDCIGRLGLDAIQLTKPLVLITYLYTQLHAILQVIQHQLGYHFLCLAQVAKLSKQNICRTCILKQVSSKGCFKLQT